MQRVSKLDAATRQLNSAISLLFADADPIAVHSLAVSAANLFSDLVENEVDLKSWREMMREDHRMSPSQIRSMLHRSWNFFKHADRDPAEVLEFDTKESEYIIFYATLECGEIHATSTEMQIFQLWFLAAGRTKLDENNEIQRFSETMFPGLHEFPRPEQLRAGA